MRGTIKVGAKCDKSMNDFLSHYRFLPLDQQKEFLTSVGVVLYATSSPIKPDYLCKGLVYLILECARNQDLQTLSTLVERFDWVTDIDNITQPVIKELVIQNNVSALVCLHTALQTHWNFLQNHYESHCHLKWTAASLWRPAFEVLAISPSYVDVKTITDTIAGDIPTMDLVENFEKRLGHKSQTLHNSIFFETLYSILCARDDCKAHYMPYLMFRLINPLSQPLFCSLLKTMCHDMPFESVLKLAPSEHFSFPPEQQKWVKFLYDSSEDLDDGWLEPVYLQKNNRLLGVHRIIKTAQAFERFGLTAQLSNTPGVERMWLSVRNKMEEADNTWIENKLLNERLHNSIEATTYTSVRKI